jgi:hypothetical protein
MPLAREAISAAVSAAFQMPTSAICPFRSFGPAGEFVAIYNVSIPDVVKAEVFVAELPPSK